MYRILEIDGGGVRGNIPSVILNYIETRLNKRSCDIFDLITGTSTGSIIGGCLAAGIPAKTIDDLYRIDCYNLFKPRFLLNPERWRQGKYDRRPFVNKLDQFLGDTLLGQVKTKFMSTSYNLSSGRTHFLHSWDPHDSSLLLKDVISWSALTATYFFGKMNVPYFTWNQHYPLYPMGPQKVSRTGASFQDGGQGTCNCTLDFCMTELQAKNIQDEVFILSLGCGYGDPYTPYSKTSKKGLIGQMTSFPFEARKESTENQVGLVRYVSESQKNISFCRLDTILDSKMQGLDNTRYINYYREVGQSLANAVPLNKLM